MSAGGFSNGRNMPPGYLTVAQERVMGKLTKGRDLATIRTSGKIQGPRIIQAIDQLVERGEIKVVDRGFSEITYLRIERKSP